MIKFKKGQFAIYKNKNELVEIKEVVILTKLVQQHKEGESVDDQPTGDLVYTEVPMYRVFTHTGDTSAMCSEDLLEAIPNDYAFNIIRKSVEEETQNKLIDAAVDTINHHFDGAFNMLLIGYESDNAFINISDDSDEDDDRPDKVLKRALRGIFYGKQ